MKKRGLFISFEGIDGAGKSTHLGALARAFEAQGRVVTLTREPGGTPLAEKLRAIILNDTIDSLTEVMLVFAARREHLQQLIEPALARGEVVISDRFTDATFAYQGSGRGYDWQTLLYLERLVQTVQGLEGDFVRQPDLTLWFELDPEIAAQRLAGARVPDKFESQSAAFFDRVSHGYAQRLQADPGRFARIAADNPRETVWLSVLQAVQQKGWLV
ncbi:dTMP kinase [Rhodoferax antarcticus]|uniref:Thymidylate kinase n=1 Tax=Rhodoferax antarcticus ANT.BR TaxID=1111071 RepID=A0A1Q8YB01_9BURK|nr:dTMP kinase [Rhodoferax antarcticus]APW46756.1 dTMP kinase [Rhodoferax antarcticus]MCW2311224.1 dTMP kinase [Rhodoferax antarcticus]OLP05228.1 thymidylate kinase [Rhodoferax antarcticus ANT.BR]